MDQEQINEFNENIRSMNDQMSVLADALIQVSKGMSGFIKDLDKSDGAFDEFDSSMQDASGSLRNIARQEREAFNDKRRAAQERKKYLDDAFNSSKAALGGFGDALISSERSFSKYNSVIGSSTDALSSMVAVLGPLGQAFSVLIKLIGLVAQGAANQADNLVTATDTLKNMGTAGAFTSEEFLELANNAGVASSNFEILTKPIRSLGSSILALGTSAGDSAISFMKLTDVSEEERMRMRRLGVDQEELIQTQADFVKLQQLSGVQLSSRYRTEDQLRKASLEYVTNLKELSSLTGEDVDTLKKRQQEMAAQAEFQIRNIQLQEKENQLREQGLATGNEELIAEADRIQAQIAAEEAARNLTASFGDPRLTQGMTELLTTGGSAISEVSGYLRNAIPDIDSYLSRIREGDKTAAAEMMESFKDNMINIAASGQGEAAILSAEYRENVLFMSDELLAKMISMKDIDISEGLDNAADDIRTASEEAFDVIISGRARLTETEIAAAVAMDQILYPAAEILSSGFIKLNEVVTDLTMSFDKLLGFIPGYESRTELEGDIASEQIKIEEARQNISEAEQDDGFFSFSRTRRNIAQNTINAALDRQALSAVELIEKGGTIDNEEILNQVIERVEKQLADSEQRIQRGSYIVGEREEFQRRLDILRQEQSNIAPVTQPEQVIQPEQQSSAEVERIRRLGVSQEEFIQVQLEAANTITPEVEPAQVRLVAENTITPEVEPAQVRLEAANTITPEVEQPIQVQLEAANTITPEIESARVVSINTSNLTEDLNKITDAFTISGIKRDNTANINNTLEDGLYRQERMDSYSDIRNQEREIALLRTSDRNIQIPNSNSITPELDTQTNIRRTETNEGSSVVRDNVTQTERILLLNEQLITMLSQKLDTVINILGDSVDIQDRSFRYNSV